MIEPRRVVDAALDGERAWVVGGAVRDALLGHAVLDVDVVVDGDPAAAALAVARASGRGTARFALSDAFETWRVVGPGHAWQVDVTPLRGGGIEADLALRDLTVNAMAEPVGEGGGGLVDPTGGRADLEARIARAVSDRSFAEDPLRTLRVARFACELELAVDPHTAQLARAHAPELDRIAGERIFAELKRVIAAPRIRAGLALMDELDVMAHVLPELSALRGVEQNRYHHADVLDHTLEVLDSALALEADPGAALGLEHADAIRALLAEPLADGLTRRDGLRLGALLHDSAKPQTRAVGEHGETLGFPRHDVEGERLVRSILTRLKASERLRGHVGALTRHHLRLGFLLHDRDADGILPRRALYRYLTTTEPVEVDVTLLSVADRLATRGHKADESIARHMVLAREVVGEALRWRAGETRPAPLLRGDELARELGIDPGPELGRLLAELAEARFAGEIRDRQEALAAARALLDPPAG
ncbi:HD domain-containing protein [Capillimicrobium parvum]|uniref:CC-adding tRNA nucleotidyltransferase n=1 Tax=Capillimicrobium parvum TaxID=2884022 RepID=A0A9E6Y1F9_9ACTN|nr:HD domain-containing protein [Capillimicrobium parvum]UGS37671.1 CC-adding tRNA nucleotidyltransferase [Capillimicrobium parvum]